MEWVEVTAKTVAEAKDKALDYLGVDEAQAEFEVLEEPRVGLFKRLKGEARVRARIRPTVPRPKAERRDRRRGRPKEGGRPGSEGSSSREPREARDAGEDRGERPARSDRRGGRSSGGRGRAETRRTGPASAGTPGSDATEEREPAPVRPRDAEVAAAPAVSEQPTPVPSHQSPPAQEEPVSREEPMTAMSDEERSEAPTDDGRQTEHAVDFLSGLVAAFGLEATVSAAEVDDHYDEARIDGSDLGLLIGPKAVTLDAVQELTRVVAQRRSGGRGESRLRVDIGGYRQRRREALERFARKLAEEVRTSGKTKALEPMNSADRKVVHDVIGTIEGVSTLSEGEDPRRRVVIVPGS
ncbi:MAG: RNA-binding cell elongation regulator Jag/EloR [Acidimicrobiales bacterium]